MNEKTRKICGLGMFTALYVVLSMFMKFPLVGHIMVDLGYVAFGAALAYFGGIGTIVGVLGCVIWNLMFNGFFPVGQMAGNLMIGIICSFCFKFCHGSKKMVVVGRCLFTAIAVFVGIVIVKTAIECVMFSVPLGVKLVKDLVAFALDAPATMLGVSVEVYVHRGKKNGKD